MGEGVAVAEGATRLDQPGEVRRLLAELGVRPYRGWGQNFLIDPEVPRRMVELAGLAPGDHVVEVGPGLGVLTGPLLAAGARVTAVELDPRLADYLGRRFADAPALRLIVSDILRLAPAELAPTGEEYTVVANLPYAITGAVLRRLLDGPRRPRRLVVMVQVEVAQRLTAAPPEMSLLAVGVQLFGRPRLALRVPADAFLPPPKVDSAVVVLDIIEPPLDADGRAALFRLAAAGFGQRRKMLANSLSAGGEWPRPAVEAGLLAAGIDPQRRAETLTIDEWLALRQAMAALGDEGAS